MTDDMIEKAAAMLWECEFGNSPWPPPDDDDDHWYARHYRSTATKMLAAAIPVVDSVEALEALPVGTKLIGSDGTVWWSHYRWFRCTKDGYDHKAVHILADHGPLRVIWKPEAPK